MQQIYCNLLTRQVVTFIWPDYKTDDKKIIIIWTYIINDVIFFRLHSTHCVYFTSTRSRCCHTDRCGSRPSKVPAPRWKASSQLPGPGLRDRHPLCSAPSNGNGRTLAWRSGWHTQDHPGLPSGGEVCHVGWRRVHAQAGPEWYGDAEGQPHLGIREYHRGGQLHHWSTLYCTDNVYSPITNITAWKDTNLSMECIKVKW